MAKILLVEDDNNLREIYEARLMAEGYDIVSARDGEEALTVAMKERPDLIISDVMMPKISGFDMLDIIRSTEETKNAKVIMMTALSQAEDKERATKLGADRYLVKSQVTLEDVAKVAREVLAGDSGGAAPAAEPAISAPAIAQAPTVPEPTSTPVPAPATSVTPAATTTPPAEPSVAPATPTPEPSTKTAPEPAVTPAPDAQAGSTTPLAAAPAAEPASQAQSATTPSAPAAQATVAAPTVAVAVEPNPDTNKPTTEEVASKAMEAIMPAATTEPESAEQPVEDEQSAIAAQIESFIETNKSDSPKPDAASTPEPASAPAESPEPSATPAVATTPGAESVAAPATPTPEPTKEEPETPSGTNGKKVIQPISDPNASKGPDLENLLKKEEEKQQMQEIAKTVAAEKSGVAEERSAEAVLKKAAMNPATVPESENTNHTPQVAITENGDLQVKTEPTPQEDNPSTESAQPAVQTAPVIPHQNGGNIDGVVQPNQNPQQSQTKVDPNSIAL